MRRAALALLLALGPWSVACLLNPQPLPPQPGPANEETPDAGVGNRTPGGGSSGGFSVGESDAAVDSGSPYDAQIPNVGRDAGVADAVGDAPPGDAGMDGAQPDDAVASSPKDAAADAPDARLDDENDRWRSDSEGDAPTSFEASWDAKRRVGGD
jgi:hypothetical protein